LIESTSRPSHYYYSLRPSHVASRISPTRVFSCTMSTYHHSIPTPTIHSCGALSSPTTKPSPANTWRARSETKSQALVSVATHRKPKQGNSEASLCSTTHCPLKGNRPAMILLLELLLSINSIDNSQNIALYPHRQLTTVAGGRQIHPPASTHHS
jgi:hypothetical protein